MFQHFAGNRNQNENVQRIATTNERTNQPTNKNIGKVISIIYNLEEGKTSALYAQYQHLYPIAVCIHGDKSSNIVS